MNKLIETRTSGDLNVSVTRLPDMPTFEAELRALRGLSGKGIAPEVISFDARTHTLTIADAGVTLHALRTEHGVSFSPYQIHRLASGIFECLTKLHAESFCHSDVSANTICVQAQTGEDGSFDLDKDFKVQLVHFGMSFKCDQPLKESLQQKEGGSQADRGLVFLDGAQHYGQAADVFGAAASVVHMIGLWPEGIPVTADSPAGQIRMARENLELKRPVKASSGETISQDLQVVLYSTLNPDPKERPSSKTSYHLLGLAA